MKIRDPLPDWCEPQTINSWGKDCSPPLDEAWLDYINLLVHPDTVTVAGRMLLPSFVEHEGGVFLRDGFTLEGYLRWEAELGDLQAIERMLNHRHVYDLFSASDNISEASYAGVASLMGQTWGLSLKACFPDRRFKIEVSNTDEDYGPTLTFWSLLSE